MSAIRSSQGLISGLDIGQISSALVARQQAAITKIENRGAQYSAQQTALTAVEASVLSLQTSIDSLTNDVNYERFSVNGGDDSFSITAGNNAVAGDYSVRAVRLASTHSVLSSGFSSADAKLGPGTITIRTGGELEQDVLLDTLNQGDGFRGGTVRLTNRDGETAEIDLSGVTTTREAIDAINASGISITATAHGDRIDITDATGGAGSLIVEDVSGAAAASLGIAGDVTADSITGSSIFAVTEDFTFEFLGGGLGIRTAFSTEDLQITTTDGSVIEVNLDDAKTIGEVISAINDDDENAGKVTAQLTNGRLELTDTTAGGGTLSVANLNDASVLDVLGLNSAAVGNTLTGQKLSAGLNTSLLRNLNGGSGIETLGNLQLTNRNGDTATIDLSAAETLQEVVDAINGATSAGLVDLQLTATVDDAGTGLTIIDGSGGAGNLVIADATGTLAADLGIAVDAAVSSVDSGSLNRRFVNEATSLATYSPSGNPPEPGQIQITDSAGNTSAISVSSAVETIGDVIQRINADTTINVTAQLNETGDGFVLIDEAGGAGTLEVAELDSTTAADLRLLGDAVTGTDGKQRISSRFAAVVEVSADDTLTDIVERLNADAAFATAALFDDGSSFNPTRLSITSATSGSAGRLVIESDIDFGLFENAAGEDAVAQVGPGSGLSFTITSSTNRFEDAVADLDITLQKESDEASTVTVDRNFSSIRVAISSLVSNFNSATQAISSQTRYNAETEQRGVLQGDGFTLRVQTQLTSLFSRRFGSSNDVVRSLADLGVTFKQDGTASFDESQFNSVSEANPDALETFFNTEGGFGEEADALLVSLTDPDTGGFQLQKNSLQIRVDDTAERVETLTARMIAARERYLLEFAQMESILASLDSQSQALTAFSNRGNNS